MKLKNNLGSIALALACFALAGCSSNNQSGGSGGSGGSADTAAKSGADGKATPTPDGKTYTIGMSQSNLGEPWRVQMNKDMRKPPASTPKSS